MLTERIQRAIFAAFRFRVTRPTTATEVEHRSSQHISEWARSPTTGIMDSASRRLPRRRCPVHSLKLMPAIEITSQFSNHCFTQEFATIGFSRVRNIIPDCTGSNHPCIRKRIFGHIRASKSQFLAFAFQECEYEFPSSQTFPVQQTKGRRHTNIPSGIAVDTRQNCEASGASQIAHDPNLVESPDLQSPGKERMGEIAADTAQ